MTSSHDAATVSASELLDALGDLMHVNKIAVHSNQGGSWFYDPDGMGTYPLDPEAIMALREKVGAEYEAAGHGWMLPDRWSRR